MIGRLRGEVIYKKPPQLMLEVSGVGYELEAPMSTFYDLPEAGAQVTLFTHLLVRDDAQVLYGFAQEPERALFRSLLKVTGVGARMALAILSGMDAQSFAACVQREDVVALTRLPGIGKKTAERLIVEMRDRLDRLPNASAVPAATPKAPGGPVDSPLEDAVSALVALGYRPVDATRMVRAVDDGNRGSEAMIRAALKAAAKID
jgi:Holliday junction DNA helicase RuvA